MTLGLRRPPNEINVFNTRYLIWITLYSVSTFFSAWTVIDSETMGDYAMCFSMASSSMALLNAFGVLILQILTIYKLIDRYEMIKKKREFQTSNYRIHAHNLVNLPVDD